MTSPERGASCSRDWRVRRDARALAGRARRGDRPGHRARAARARHRARRRARRAPSPRGWSRRWPACRSRARSWSRAPRGPRRARPTRCARAAPRSTSLALYETVAEPLDDADRAAARRRRLPDLHLGLDGALLPGRGGRRARRPAARLDRPGHERRRCASTAPSPTSRPTRTRPTAWSTALRGDADARVLSPRSPACGRSRSSPTTGSPTSSSASCHARDRADLPRRRA